MKDWFNNKNVLLIAVSVTVAAIWLSNNNDDEQKTPNTKPALLVVTAGRSYRYDENGKNNTILSAPTTTHYQDARGTQFIQPNLIHLNGNATTTLNADYAIENKARTIIDMQGNVVGTHNVEGEPKRSTRFESERLIYRIPANEAENDVPIKITTPESETHAIGTLWHLNQNLFILKKNVRSHYAPIKES